MYSLCNLSTDVIYLVLEQLRPADIGSMAATCRLLSQLCSAQSNAMIRYAKTTGFMSKATVEQTYFEHLSEYNRRDVLNCTFVRLPKCCEACLLCENREVRIDSRHHYVSIHSPPACMTATCAYADRIVTWDRALGKLSSIYIGTHRQFRMFDSATDRIFLSGVARWEPECDKYDLSQKDLEVWHSEELLGSLSFPDKISGVKAFGNGNVLVQLETRQCYLLTPDLSTHAIETDIAGWVVGVDRRGYIYSQKFWEHVLHVHLLSSRSMELTPFCTVPVEIDDFVVRRDGFIVSRGEDDRYFGTTCDDALLGKKATKIQVTAAPPNLSGRQWDGMGRMLFFQ